MTDLEVVHRAEERLKSHKSDRLTLAVVGFFFLGLGLARWESAPTEPLSVARIEMLLISAKLCTLQLTAGMAMLIKVLLNWKPDPFLMYIVSNRRVRP